MADEKTPARLILSAADVRYARKKLGLSQSELARTLRMGDEGARSIRRWETGEKGVSGPASVAIEALLDGWRC
jgi:DNA-binding transcriptional regulator YiaG